MPLVTGEFVLHVLTIGAYYVILAVSWNLLAGFTGQFSLAQHAFAAIGAYVSGLLIYHLKTPLLVSIPAGILAAALARLPARPSGAAHAHDLSLDRHLGVRRDLSHRARPRPMTSPAATSA